MSAVSEEHTPVSRVLVLLFPPKVKTSRAVPVLYVWPFLALALFGMMDSSNLMTVHFVLAALHRCILHIYRSVCQNINNHHSQQNTGQKDETTNHMATKAKVDHRTLRSSC